MKELAELTDIARAAANLGSELLASIAPQSISAKKDRDYVTDLDFRIQLEIKQFLSDKTPSIDFLGEETEPEFRANLDTSRLWILDPIDGTSNFIHRVPLCAVSLALTSQGAPIVAVINAPFLGLEYYAATGTGAFVNDRRISTSVTNNLNRAIVSIGDYAVGANADQKNQRRLAVTAALAAKVERVRMFGSAALDLAWVAEGRTDATLILANNPWDMAAGVLIAREAGAVITDAEGKPYTFGSLDTIVTTPSITHELLTTVSGINSR